MSNGDPTYQELQDRLAQTETILAALRNGEVDAVISHSAVLLLCVQEVEAALRDRFSFAAREFGQPVTLSEVIAVMQDVAGVIAVDVDRLYRTDGVGADDQTCLPSASPGVGDGPSAEAAELLTISSAPVVLKVMS